MDSLTIAMIIPDNREESHRYDLPLPVFGPGPAELIEGFGGVDGIHLHILSCTKKPLEGPLTLASNITYHPLQVPQWGWLRSGYAGCIRACRRKIHELKPDVVHGSGTERYCALAAVFSGKPNVITIHGNMRSLAKLYRARALSYLGLSALFEGLAVRRTGGVVCLTHYTENNVKNSARRTWIVPNAIPTSFFDLKRIPDDVPLLLVPATIASHKNQNLLMQALDGVASRQKFRLLFVGARPDPETNTYVGEFDKLLSSRPWCEYGGLVSREELRMLLVRATAVLLMSREDNCPNAVLEAMAAGVPVVAARVGGIPDLIDHGQSGLLVDPENMPDMAKAVEQILTSPAQAAKFASIARGKAEHYRPSAIVAKHMALYHAVAEAI